MEEIVLLGFGGHSKSVIDTIERQNEYKIIGVLEKKEKREAKYRGYRCIGGDEKLEELFKSGIKHAFVTLGFMGKADIRNRIYYTLKAIGFTLPVKVDPSCLIAKDVSIGEGTFVGKGAIINADAHIGKMCIINTGSILEHETKVGDFCHISVGTLLCGQVQVGDNSFIGAGATVIQGIHVGSGSIVGAGSSVVKKVDDNTLVYGKTVKRL